jgi:hypothetical protein
MVIGGASLAPGHALAQASAVEIEQRLDFKAGTPKARAMLQRVAAVRDMVEEGFDVATVDLNDDGRKEIVVLARSASYCGSGGCALIVLEQQGSTMKTLATLGTDGALGVTRQRFGAYRALAAIDQQGRVVIGNKPGAPLHGKPLVYPMAGERVPATVAAPRAAQPEPPKAQAQAAAVTAPSAPSIAGIQLGMSAADVHSALQRLASSYGLRRLPPTSDSPTATREAHPRSLLTCWRGLT